jgi:hypothetical protein
MTYFNQNQVHMYGLETILFLKPILGMDTEPALGKIFCPPPPSVSPPSPILLRLYYLHHLEETLVW